eukprot:4592285-Amphidinium_carterae.1
MARWLKGDVCLCAAPGTIPMAKKLCEQGACSLYMAVFCLGTSERDLNAQQGTTPHLPSKLWMTTQQAYDQAKST